MLSENVQLLLRCLLSCYCFFLWHTLRNSILIITKVSSCLPTLCFNALLVSWLDKVGAGDRCLLLFTQISTNQTKKPLFLRSLIQRKTPELCPHYVIQSHLVKVKLCLGIPTSGTSEANNDNTTSIIHTHSFRRSFL